MSHPRGRRPALVYGVAIVSTAIALLAVYQAAVRIAASPRPVALVGRPGPITALVVLPFVPMSPGEGDASFGIGLADSIIVRLSRIKGMTVLPLSAALEVSAQTTDPAEAARRASAGAALVGRYRHVGDSIKLTAQVLDAERGFVIWARDFESSVEGLIPAEEALATAAAAALVPGPLTGGDATSEIQLGGNATAHYLWLLARGKLAQGESGVLAEAVGLLEQAITIDPRFARAHASLAEASTEMFLTGLGDGTSWLDRAVIAARRAIYLDETDPAGHFSLGQALLVRGQPVEGARELLRALALDPDHAPTLRYVAIMLNAVGMGESFPDLVKRIETLDPTMDVGWILIRYHERQGTMEALRDRLEGEIRRRRKAGISIEPTAMQLGVVSYVMGDAAAALRWAARLEQLSSNREYIEMLSLLAQARLMDREAAYTIIDRNRAAFGTDWDYAGLVARATGTLGDTDATLNWLSLSASAGSCDAWGFENLEEFANVKHDPRYLAAYGIVKGRAEGITDLLLQAGYR